MICVNSVKVSPSETEVLKGDWCYELRAEVTPANASCCSVVWSSSNTNVATVNSITGYVYAKSEGTARIYATATDGSGKKDSCLVRVIEIPVESVSLCPCKKTLCAGETLDLVPIIEPFYATDTDVIWSNSEPSIAEVEVTEYGVKVSGKAAGTTVITVTTADGHHTATCEVTVDMRERVTVKKDGDYFTVTFADNTVWKSIGCNLATEEDQNIKTASTDRYNYNKTQEYSEKQLGYIYLLDPLGVEHYIEHYACKDKTVYNSLIFKDNVYKEIFDVRRGWFFFRVNDDGIVEYIDYGDNSGDDRSLVFSNAEILFGFHKIFDWSNFWRDICEYIFTSIPVISEISQGIDVCNTLFFSGSFVGLYTDTATSYAEDYFKDTIANGIKSKLWKKTVSPAFWVANLFITVVGSTIDSFVVPNSKDLVIYDKIRSQKNYRAEFIINGSKYSMDDFIERCNIN